MQKSELLALIFRYVSIVIFSIYAIVYQSWFSFIYLLTTMFLITFEIQPHYQLISNENPHFQIKKLFSYQKKAFLFLFAYSFGILVYKIVFLAMQSEKFQYFFNPGPSFEYYMNENIVYGDVLLTLIPSFVNLIISLMTLVVTCKKSIDIEVNKGSFNRLGRFLNLKMILTKLSLATCLFFIPIATVSVSGIVVFLFFMAFYAKQIFFYQENDIFPVENLIKLTIGVIFSFNYLVLLPEFGQVNQDFYGLDAFRGKGYSFQVQI